MSQIEKAQERLAPFLHKTPLITSQRLNSIFGHNFVFKAEGLQKTGAFKIRGALNHLLSLKERGELPPHVVTYSTGNHGIAVAYCAKLLNINARIYLPSNTCRVKQEQAISFGGQIIITQSRIEAENRAHYDGLNGLYYLHPSDSMSTIEGHATLCFEALTQSEDKIDAIFASCGGGGLLSGCYLAKERFDSSIKVIGVEPEIAGDAYRSRNTGEIYQFTHSPNTIADGLRTLRLSKRTFEYIKKLDDFVLVSEDEIKYWTIWLMHLLKILCEPSCATSMAGAYKWIKAQDARKNILIIISGGNIDLNILSELLEGDYLLRRLEDLPMEIHREK